MKILIVSQYFWPEHFVVNSLSSRLVKHGHEVQILTALPNYPSGKFFKGYGFFNGPWFEDFEGARVHRVPILPRRSGFLWLSVNYISFVFFGILPGAFSVKKDFDVIFCMGLSPITSCLPAIFFKKITGKPLVFWVQDLWPESVAAVGATKSSWGLRAVGSLVRFIYRRCDLILMQSEAFRTSVLRWGGQSEKLRYVPNWAPTISNDIHAVDWVNDLPKGFNVIFAGNIGKAQAIPTILKAAAQLSAVSDINWIIVGDGSSKEFLENEIQYRNLKSCVLVLGRKPHHDMPALMSKGDVMLVTLTNEPIFSLTVPSKIQGYMSSGKPILACLNGEGARIGEVAGAGLTCGAEDSEALAARVLEFYKMTLEQRLEFGTRGHDYFKTHFEENLIVQKIETALKDAVSVKAASS
jgi:colanic acid biosynthesis glycosyl transferase WcaI